MRIDTVNPTDYELANCDHLFNMYIYGLNKPFVSQYVPVIFSILFQSCFYIADAISSTFLEMWGAGTAKQRGQRGLLCMRLKWSQAIGTVLSEFFSVFPLPNYGSRNSFSTIINIIILAQKPHNLQLLFSIRAIVKDI